MLSSTVWPPIAADDLRKAEQESLKRELQWLLKSLQSTLASLKAGLEECTALLSPDKGASTLVLSSLRSESIKGFVTRVGTRVVKGDISLKLASIPPPRGQQSHRLTISSKPEAPAVALEEIATVRSLINASLDVIDVTTWTGDANNADFVASQLRLLLENVQEARLALKGGGPNQKAWWEAPLDDSCFDPPCPSNISFHLSIADAALVLHVRTLEPADAPPAYESMSGLSIRERFALALGAQKVAPHEEIGDRFNHKGNEVRVREMHRVESQDPSLLSAMAKLSAVEHSVAMSRKALATVMQKDYD